jgi:hypothetical protein
MGWDAELTCRTWILFASSSKRVVFETVFSFSINQVTDHIVLAVRRTCSPHSASMTWSTLAIAHPNHPVATQCPACSGTWSTSTAPSTARTAATRRRRRRRCRSVPPAPASRMNCTRSKLCDAQKHGLFEFRSSDFHQFKLDGILSDVSMQYFASFFSFSDTAFSFPLLSHVNMFDPWHLSAATISIFRIADTFAVLTPSSCCTRTMTRMCPRCLNACWGDAAAAPAGGLAEDCAARRRGHEEDIYTDTLPAQIVVETTWSASFRCREESIIIATTARVRICSEKFKFSVSSIVLQKSA